MSDGRVAMLCNLEKTWSTTLLKMQLDINVCDGAARSRDSSLLQPSL